MQSSPHLHRQDVRGRVRTPPDRKAAILAEFAQSGMTGMAFAAHVGVKYPTFAAWLRQQRIQAGDTARPDSGITPPKVHFVEAQLPSTPSPPSFELLLPGGAIVRVHDGSKLPLIADLLRLLRSC